MPADRSQITDETAFNLRQQGRTYSQIAAILGFDSHHNALHAVARHARLNGLADPIARRSTREAARYARSAGLPFDADAFADLNEAQSEAVGGAIFTGRTFGVEIEFTRPNRSLAPETIAQALRDAGLECHAEDYNHRTVPHWKLIHDASTDRELVSPVLSGREGLRQVRTAMNVLRSLGCRITSNDGQHVHVYVGDMTPVSIASIVRFYVQRHDAINMLVPASRRSGQYCMRMSARDAEQTEQYAQSGRVVATRGRYVTVNLESYSRYQTVEFRQGAGTLMGRKSNDWTELMLAIVTLVENGNAVAAPSDLWGMLDYMVAQRVLKQATADRLVRKAAGYGFARPAVLAQAV